MAVSPALPASIPFQYGRESVALRLPTYRAVSSCRRIRAQTEIDHLPGVAGLSPRITKLTAAKRCQFQLSVSGSASFRSSA